jgi:hypothetical protein
LRNVERIRDLEGFRLSVGRMARNKIAKMQQRVLVAELSCRRLPADRAGTLNRRLASFKALATEDQSFRSSRRLSQLLTSDGFLFCDPEGVVSGDTEDCAWTQRPVRSIHPPCLHRRPLLIMVDGVGRDN